MASTRSRIPLGILLAVTLLAACLFGVDLQAIAEVLAAADPVPLFGVVLLTVAAYAARAWRWGDILRPIALVRQGDLFSATMVGFAANLVVPRSGELLRPWLVARREGFAATSAFATIVIERLVDLFSVLTMFALYLLVLPEPVAQVENTWITTLEVGGGVAAAVLMLLLALLWALHTNADRTASTIARLFARGPSKLAERVNGVLHGFAGGLAVLKAPWSLWARIALKSVLVWGLTAWSYQLVQQSLGVLLPWHTTFLLIAFLVVGESIPTPGLVGGFHAFYLLVLSEVFGVDRHIAAAAAIVAHALTNLPVLVIGGVMLPREGLSWRRAMAGDVAA